VSTACSGSSSGLIADVFQEQVKRTEHRMAEEARSIQAGSLTVSRYPALLSSEANLCEADLVGSISLDHVLANYLKDLQ